MSFSLVSRSRFEDQRTDLNRLRDELAFERERNQKLWNWATWRLDPSHAAFDPTLLPEAYRPRPVGAVAAPVKDKDDLRDSELPVKAAPRSASQARRAIGDFEAARMLKFKTEDAMRTAPANAGKDQREVAERLGAVITGEAGGK